MRRGHTLGMLALVVVVAVACVETEPTTPQALAVADTDTPAPTATAAASPTPEPTAHPPQTPEPATTASLTATPTPTHLAEMMTPTLTPTNGAIATEEPTLTPTHEAMAMEEPTLTPTHEAMVMEEPTLTPTHEAMAMEEPTPTPTPEVMAMEEPYTPTPTPEASAAEITSTPEATRQEPAVQEFAIIENYAATRFSPGEIMVLKDIPVKLYLTRLHREHINRFAVSPFFSSSEVILPGEVGLIEFLPDQLGKFEIRNVGHNFEATLVVVETMEEVRQYFVDKGVKVFALIHSIDDSRIFP